MRPKFLALAAGMLAAASLAPAQAAVTVTETTIEIISGGGAFSNTPEQVPVYVLENQWISVVIQRGPVSHPTVTVGLDSSIGAVVGVTKKQGKDVGTRQVSINQGWTTAGPSTSHIRSYIHSRDRVNSKDPVAGSQTVTFNVAGDGSEATVTVNEQSGETGIAIQKIYRLVDNAKYYETRMIYTNNKGADWTSGSVGAGAITLMYLTPGGSSGSNDPADRLFAKTVDGATTMGGLFVGRASTWFGAGGTPLAPALAEGWYGIVDPNKDVVIATTWDLQQQADHAGGTTVGSRFGFFSNRATFEVFYRYLPSAQPLDHKQYLIFDDELKSPSYAKEGKLLAGIELDKQYDDAYAPGSVMTATFKLNSLNPTASETYSIQNIRIEAKDPFGGSPSLTAAPISNVVVASNAHVSNTRTITLTDPSLEVGKSYQLKADLMQNGSLVSTLSSRQFIIDPSEVLLFMDDTGSWVLENQFIRATIGETSPNQSRLTHFVLKNANGRNQTITSIPPHPLFRDFIQPESGPDSSGTAFGAYGIPPNIVENTNTRKALEFTANAPGNQGGQLVKTYALSSKSTSLEVKFKFTNGPTPLMGGGIYSDLEMAPGSTGGSSDNFFAHTANGLFTHHPPTAEQTAFKRWFFGEKWDVADPTVGIPGDFPELDQPWMGVVDVNATDTTVLAWDKAVQTNFSLPLGAGGPKVTMNSFGIGANYDRTVVEARFTNIPAGGVLDTTYYLMGDTGYRAVSYAEPGRVLAGLWPLASEAPQGVFAAPYTLTNVGTTERKFTLKNIRVSSGGTDTVVAPDEAELTLAAGARFSGTLSLNLAALATGSYTIKADLYEGATLVATLDSLAFTLTGAAPATGDIDNDGGVDLDDATLALQVWGGLVAADAGNVSRGDLVTGNGITLEDAVAIAKKAVTP